MFLTILSKKVIKLTFKAIFILYAMLKHKTFDFWLDKSWKQTNRAVTVMYFNFN